MAELKNALRSGDVSVSGSRQFRAFEEYLMPHTEFNERLANGSLHLAVSTSAAAYLEAHVCHSYAKRSIKPNRLPLKGSYQMQN